MMIKINLIPEELQKKKKGQIFKKILKVIPLETLVGTAAGVLILLIGVHVLLQISIFLKLASYGQHKAHWTSIAPEKGSVDKVLENLQILKKRIDVVEKITVEKRIFWAEKLNAISDAVPQGVWLDKISLSKNIFLIKGSAVSKKNDEMTSVGNFSSSLKEREEFMFGLQDIEVGSIQRRDIHSTQIADFVITLRLDEKFDK
ncbi:MAG: PilN domain-containing protein [Candidatus Omnitrophica bacterium]|nr:PilN domain-containing protein [Candidatus Omnitrophota bacterium]